MINHIRKVNRYRIALLLCFVFMPPNGWILESIVILGSGIAFFITCAISFIYNIRLYSELLPGIEERCFRPKQYILILYGSEKFCFLLRFLGAITGEQALSGQNSQMIQTKIKQLTATHSPASTSRTTASLFTSWLSSRLHCTYSCNGQGRNILQIFWSGCYYMRKYIIIYFVHDHS